MYEIKKCIISNQPESDYSFNTSQETKVNESVFVFLIFVSCYNSRAE